MPVILTGIIFLILNRRAEILRFLFEGRTERIRNPSAYMLTLLYNAKEQMHLDIVNQVSHDSNS